MKLESQDKNLERCVKKDDFSVGKKLKETRIGKKITTKRMAEFLNVEPQQVLRYEKDEQGISISKIRNICEFLNIRPDELLGMEMSDVREQPQDGTVYDWEIKDAGVYWVCPKCGLMNVCYGANHIELCNSNKLETECENEDCGEFFNKFWRK